MKWFNLSAPWMRVGGKLVRLWNLFNRCSTHGHYWGIGLLQIGSRSLLYVGFGPRVEVLFIALWDRSEVYADQQYKQYKAER